MGSNNNNRPIIICGGAGMRRNSKMKGGFLLGIRNKFKEVKTMRGKGKQLTPEGEEKKSAGPKPNLQSVDPAAEEFKGEKALPFPPNDGKV